MNLVLFIISTSEVDALISLLQRFDLFVIENLEVGVLQDLEGVESGLVVSLVLNGESGGRCDDHGWNLFFEVWVVEEEGRVLAGIDS